MRTLHMILMAVAATIIAAGCGVGVDEAEAEVCDALEAFTVSLGDARSLTADATGDEADAAMDAYDNALDDLGDATAQLQDLRLDRYVEEREAIRDELRGIEGDQALEDAATVIIDGVDRAFNEAEQVFGDLECPGVLRTG